jgi:hypothetical protein
MPGHRSGLPWKDRQGLSHDVTALRFSAGQAILGERTNFLDQRWFGEGHGVRENNDSKKGGTNVT